MRARARARRLQFFFINFCQSSSLNLALKMRACRITVAITFIGQFFFGLLFIQISNPRITSTRYPHCLFFWMFENSPFLIHTG